MDYEVAADLRHELARIATALEALHDLPGEVKRLTEAVDGIRDVLFDQFEHRLQNGVGL